MKADVRRVLMLSSGVILICACTLNGAQKKRSADSTDVSFVEPIIGHVFDGNKQQIRSILGIPGAARVADPIPLNANAENAILSASGGLAIASVTGGDAAMLVRPVDSEPTLTAISGSMKTFNAGAFSPSGTSALLYGKDCTCLQVAVSFADSPNVSRVIDITSLPGDITALAVNDDATFAAVAVAGLDDGSQPAQVFVIDLNSDAAPRLVMTSSASGLAFSPSGKDLAVVDARTHSLSLVQDVTADSAVMNVIGEPDGLAMPSAVLYLNAATVLVADRSGQVLLVDLQAKQLKAIPCNCRPTALEMMELKSTYRLTGPETGAVWILTLGDSDPVVRFVPVDDPEETQPEGAQ